MSNLAIGREMGFNESSVRSLLVPGQKTKADILSSTSDVIRAAVDDKKFVDVGAGTQYALGISSTKMNTAIARLKEEGYQVHSVKIEQLGTGKQTELKVMVPPGVTQKEAWQNRANIKLINDHSDDGGKTYTGIKPPISVDLNRVGVRYAEQGGTEADGVIYVRPGVHDLSLGSGSYSQVRVLVNGTHYLKGMALYKDDLPPGVDMVFNTNKSNTGNKLDAMKKVSDDPESPFGATVRQISDPHTGKLTSAMNIVNDEADWSKWSRNLSSQFLSKQSPTLAKTQLDMTFERKQKELADIMALTNPTVRKKMLEDYAESTDASAVHLKAAALPRQATHVILPIESMKENEVYAPNYNNGERVVLVRHPHGGTFEIPELVVNNRNPEAKKLLGDATVAIGINAKVAQKLSGADFDGDTVLVIPNNSGKVKTAPSLEGLKEFDAKAAYPYYPGMHVMTPKKVPMEMGLISNLITDMTLGGANNDELARAVRHSMVVIDAEKHKLDYKQSAINNGIPQLMKKYQGRSAGGASTLISRAKSPVYIPDRTPRPAKDGGPIDKVTGEKVYSLTGFTKTDRSGNMVLKTIKSSKLAETPDAHTLSSGTVIEKVYADHSNKLKALANQARLASVHIKTTAYSPSAKLAYASEVAALNTKLDRALKNAPLERQAQLIANANLSMKRQANPSMEAAEIKKLKGQLLTAARANVGAGKDRIEITASEWAAIQAGAISNHKLEQILDNANVETVKQLATPKKTVLMTSTEKQRATAMLASGYTRAEVAAHLGVSTTTLSRSLSG